jgi:putative transposase
MKEYWEKEVMYAGTGGFKMKASYEGVECKFCHSLNVVRNGTRRGTQYWLCKHCGRGFVDNKALPKMKYPIEAIASAVYQYYAGLSLNEIRGYIDQQYKFSPSDSAIYGWVTKFSKTAIDEAKNLTPKVGDTWVADETVLFIGGRQFWLIDIIDQDTRYLLATYLSPTRGRKDIALLLREAYLKAGKVAPKRILTDGWGAYPDAVDLVFGSETKHIVSKPFVEVDSTNVIERFQGTLKDRTKVMRGFKKPETARHILNGWLVYYNFFRPHESLGDKTPAQVAGLKFPYKNWLDIVKSQPPPGDFPKIAEARFSQPKGMHILVRKPYRKRTPKKPKRRIERGQTVVGLSATRRV